MIISKQKGLNRIMINLNRTYTQIYCPIRRDVVNLKGSGLSKAGLQSLCVVDLFDRFYRSIKTQNSISVVTLYFNDNRIITVTLR